MDSPSDNDELAKRFAGLAEQFCSIVDSAPGIERSELLLQVYRLLPKLISEAMALPPVELSHDRTTVSRSLRLAHTAESRPYRSLQEKFADWDHYLQTFDPTKQDAAIPGSLADDVADVYRDLKKGLRSKGSGPVENTIWEWRFGFYFHWGQHAIDALRVLHARFAAELGEL
jgi:hypothetical protein